MGVVVGLDGTEVSVRDNHSFALAYIRIHFLMADSRYAYLSFHNLLDDNMEHVICVPNKRGLVLTSYQLLTTKYC